MAYSQIFDTDPSVAARPAMASRLVNGTFENLAPVHGLKTLPMASRACGTF